MAPPLILLVDDDSRTRRFVVALLKYSAENHVVEAGSPGEAFAIARELGRPIDLLISDIELGDAKTGIDLAGEIAAGNPLMQVLLISGRDRPPREIPPGWRFLAKPFAIAAFLECVRKLCYPVATAA
jgi:two-component system, response regulator PdtaR